MKALQGSAIVLALTAPLLFPTACTLGIVVLASLLVPPLGLFAGLFTDALYYTPHVHVPYASLVGLCISILAYVVHRFVKARIIGV